MAKDDSIWFMETGSNNLFLNFNLMATKCDLCGRGSTKDATRSHSNIKTVKRQHINLQSRKIGDKRMNVCTKCLKTMVKAK